MWNWANDKALIDEFCAISLRERAILFFWAALPLSKFNLSGGESKTFAALSSFLGLFGLNYSNFYAFLTVFAVYLLAANPALIKVLFKKPECDFRIFKDKWGLVWSLCALAFGSLSLALLWAKPEILATMRLLSSNAKVPDWVLSALTEEVTDRFILYYSMLMIFGRNGAFLLSMLFFALFHNYNQAYMFNMIFAGSLHIFLLVWSGSLSLPLAVHILSNSAIFFWFRSFS